MKSNWKKCKISDLGTVVGGSTPSTKDDTNYGGNISWITPKDLSTFNERYIYNGERNITEKGLKSCSTQLMPKNSVLFTSRAPIGYVAIAGKEMCTNQGFKSVIPNENTDYLFLYYLLKFNKDNIENMGSGTTFKEVSGTTMKNIEVLVPESKQEQQRIATILSSIDDKIELNNSLNNNLEQQIQSIFKRNFIDSEYIFVKDTTIGDICKCELGGTPSRTKPEYWNGNIAWINSGEVNKFRITKPSEYITDLGLSKSATKLLPKKTTVLAITGATLGQISLLEIDSCANQSVVGIIENDTLPYEFIYPYVVNNIKELISHQTGGAQQHINKQNIESLKLLLPDNEIINNYKKLVKPLFETISNNCFENESLIQLRDTLLPKLMSGEIDVSNVDISTDKLSFSGGV